jgi:nitroreductase
LKVSEALATRRSVRGFLDRPVSDTLIREILKDAARAPSGGNLQPWLIHVVSGEAMQRLKAIMAKRVVEGPGGEPSDYKIYPDNLWTPYRERRYKVGEDLYASLGIPRDDKPGRLRQFARNFQFFGAPTALFCYIDRGMGPLLLREVGLDSCPQECWSVYPKTIGEFVGAPSEQMLFCGMAIGYADPNEPANTLVTQRAPLDEFVHFHA